MQYFGSQWQLCVFAIYTVSQKNCTLLFLQYLCQTKLYFDNFWHMNTLINLEQNDTKIVNLS